MTYISSDIAGVYMIRSLVKPNRFYIGSAASILQRWNAHKSDLKKNSHHSIKLQRHFNKYGSHDLVFSVIWLCSRENILEEEQYFIDTLEPYFNSSLTAGSVEGLKHSAKSIKLISIANTGRKQSEEEKLKRSLSLIGHKHTEEAKIKISVSTRGVKKSEEGRKKYSEIMLLRWANEEYRNQMSVVHKGKKQSEESIKKRNLKINKPIIQLDLDGNFIKEWESIIATQKDGFNPSHISQVCKGKRRSTNGFKWKYKDDI